MSNRSMNTRLGCVTLTTAALLATTNALRAQGGEDAASSTEIPSLPFLDTGTTVGYADDSDEVCPYTGSTSPDVWYTYTPSGTVSVDVALCESNYDTKVYIYDDALSLVACSDDACSDAAGNQFRSRLDSIELTGCETYFIVIDGWAGDAGSYLLQVDEAAAFCQTLPPFLADEVALDFDGQDDFIEVDPAPELTFDADDDITLEAWVFPDTLSGQHNVITKSADSTVNYAMRYEIDGSIGFFYRDASSTTWFEFNGQADVVVPGRWTHIAVSHTFATGDIEVVVDGELTDGSWSAIPNEGPLMTNEPLLLGASSITPGGLPSRLTDGRVDELRIWNIRRTVEDIQADMEAVLSGSEPGLVGYWRFEEGAGNATADLAGGHDGVVNGPTWIELEECVGPCPADIDDSGEVGFPDLLSLLVNWGPCPCCPEDVNADGEVGFQDLLAMLANWGPCPVATGACCLTAACLDLTADDCIAMGGSYEAGAMCADVGCPSEDGLIVTAPFVSSGNTCTGESQCLLSFSPDERWVVTIPDAGTWTFSVCGAPFDTTLSLGSAPCGADVATGDDECGVASEIQVELAAGTYYLTLEGFSTGDCGVYTLLVSQ